jgi:uncharacterized membrane protein (UPF0127 family)
MRAYRVVNQRTGQVVATHIEDATGLWASFRGLMLRSKLDDGHGMVFRPAKGIHTHLMRFPIDLIFLEKGDTVRKIRPAMKPWRFDFTNAAGVIEMNAGAAAANDIRPGDQLLFEEL